MAHNGSQRVTNHNRTAANRVIQSRHSNVSNSRPVLNCPYLVARGPKACFLALKKPVFAPKKVVTPPPPPPQRALEPYDFFDLLDGAVAINDCDAVKRLLVECRTENFWYGWNECFSPLLQKLVKTGSADVFKAVVESRRVPVTESLFSAVVLSQRIELIQYLLSRNDVNVSRGLLFTEAPFVSYKEEKIPSLEVVKELLKCPRVDKNYHSYTKMTPLHLASYPRSVFCRMPWCVAPPSEFVRAFLSYPEVDPNPVCHGHTPLWIVCYCTRLSEACLEPVRMFLRRDDIDLNVCDFDSVYPLQTAYTDLKSPPRWQRSDAFDQYSFGYSKPGSRRWKLRNDVHVARLLDLAWDKASVQRKGPRGRRGRHNVWLRRHARRSVF